MKKKVSSLDLEIDIRQKTLDIRYEKQETTRNEMRETR